MTNKSKYSQAHGKTKKLPPKHAAKKISAAQRDAAKLLASKKMSKSIVHYNLRQLQDAFANGYVSEIHIQEVFTNSLLKSGKHYEIHFSLLGRNEDYVFAPFGKNTPRQFALMTAFSTIRPFVTYGSVVINIVSKTSESSP